MIDAGFKDLSAIEADEELAGLRKDPAYVELKRIAEGGAAPAPVPVRPHPGEAHAGEEEHSDSLVMGMTGSLKVVATSADNGPASVAVDGKPRGKTPLTVELNAGKHLVVVIKQGCKPVKSEVQVPLAGTYTLNVNLDPN